MTQAIISFDTELSPRLYQQGADARANFESSVLARCEEGEYGIHHQMDRLENHGLTGVFFVDPMPALVYGPAIIADMVEPIVERGHEVQLHIHTEWLAYAKSNPIAPLEGRNIGDFPLEAQRKLIWHARKLLIEAGAPEPIAFRAGNFGANDDTLRALAVLDFEYDSSFNRAYIDQGCNLSLDPTNLGVRMHQGVCEIPISGLMDRSASFRPAQLCAMSEEEMRDALDHAAASGAIQFSAFSHSFELLSRDRSIPNPLLDQRLEDLCATVANDPRIHSGGFADLPEAPRQPGKIRVAYARPLRTLRRTMQQGMNYLRYEARILPRL